MTNDIVFVTKNLEKWAKDEKAKDIPLTNALMSPRIRKDPLGCVLVIGYVKPQILKPLYLQFGIKAAADNLTPEPTTSQFSSQLGPSLAPLRPVIQ